MDKKYNLWISLILACLLAGCASAPKPADCKGEFKPVNANGKVSLDNLKDKPNKIVRCNEGVVYG